MVSEHVSRSLSSKYSCPILVGCSVSAGVSDNESLEGGDQLGQKWLSNGFDAPDCVVIDYQFESYDATGHDEHERTKNWRILRQYVVGPLLRE